MLYSITEEQTNVLKEVQEIIHGSCVAAGWYTDLETGKRKTRNFGEVIALIHTELSEAYEGFRRDKMDEHLPDRKSMEVEMADAVIRIFDASGAMGIDLAGAIRDKFAYNQVRDDHKLENRKKPGGKKT